MTTESVMGVKFHTIYDSATGTTMSDIIKSPIVPVGKLKVVAADRQMRLWWNASSCPLDGDVR